MAGSSTETSSPWIDGLVPVLDAGSPCTRLDRASSLARQLGFDAAAFGCADFRKCSQRLRFFPADAAYGRYDRTYTNRALHRLDPLLEQGRRGARMISALPLIRRAATASPGAADHAMTEAFHDSGLGANGSVAVDLPSARLRGGVAVGYGTDRDPADFDARLARHQTPLRLIALMHVDGISAGSEAGILTHSGALVYRHLAAGARPQEIAEETGKSLRTIRHQIQSGRQRLGARTVAEALFLAARLDLLGR